MDERNNSRNGDWFLTTAERSNAQPGFKMKEYQITRKYTHAETLALLTKPLYFPNMKYL
jgi:hypothetical protein